MTTTRVDERLQREAEHYRLRFGCEDCAHFEPEAGACGNGYPTKPHLGVDLARVSALEFCKAFELS
jgi:hypothetical protein